jgi:glycosyltransferase involved in cell wall biosynthesis
MLDEGYSENSIHVIYNSMDYEEQYRIRQEQVNCDIFEKYFNNSDPIILFIGRLRKDKS